MRAAGACARSGQAWVLHPLQPCLQVGQATVYAYLTVHSCMKQWWYYIAGQNDSAVHSGTGAKHAVVTDREPLALDCALRSARASGIAGVAESALPQNGMSNLPPSAKVRMGT